MYDPILFLNFASRLQLVVHKAAFGAAMRREGAGRMAMLNLVREMGLAPAEETDGAVNPEPHAEPKADADACADTHPENQLDDQSDNQPYNQPETNAAVEAAVRAIVEAMVNAAIEAATPAEVATPTEVATPAEDEASPAAAPQIMAPLVVEASESAALEGSATEAAAPEAPVPAVQEKAAPVLPTSLSEEQRRRIEANRQQALDRIRRNKHEGAQPPQPPQPSQPSQPPEPPDPPDPHDPPSAPLPPPPAPVELSDALREQIATRRHQAAARKRQREEAERQRQESERRAYLVASIGPLQALFAEKRRSAVAAPTVGITPRGSSNGAKSTERQPSAGSADGGAYTSVEGEDLSANELERLYESLNLEQSELPLAEPPPGLRSQLRDYQRQGLSWLAEREARPFAPFEGKSGGGRGNIGQWRRYLLVDGTPFYHEESGEASLRAAAAEAARGGFLADEMGLGKTCQLIALLLHDRHEQQCKRQQRHSAREDPATAALQPTAAVPPLTTAVPQSMVGALASGASGASQAAAAQGAAA